MLVRMWQRHLRPDRDGEFKHRHGTVRVRGFEQKMYSYLPNLDNLTFHCQFASLEWWSDEVDSIFGCGGPQRLNGVG